MFVVHALLTRRACTPYRPICLISSNMNIFTWEQFHHLLQYAFTKTKCFLFSNTKLIAIQIIFAIASQPGVSAKHISAMSRHIYFRNHFDMAHRCIMHNLPNIFFRIISAICIRVALRTKDIMQAPPVIQIFCRTISGHVREVRIFIYLYSPSARIYEMEMENIDLIISKHIQHLEDKLFWKEVTGYVKHESSIAESGLIAYFGTRNGHACRC